MFRRVIHILKGAAQRTVMWMRFGIDRKKVVVILTNDNPKLDAYALLHLRDFMARKYANEALIVLNDASHRVFVERALFRNLLRMVSTGGGRDSVKVCRYPSEKIQLIYDYYVFYKFSDRIVFTVTDRPKDNMLGRALRETRVNEEDAVCLGLYHLREVPMRKGREQIFPEGKKGLTNV